MKIIILYLILCFFIGCDRTNKQQEVVKDTSERAMAPMVSETTTAVQAISNDMLGNLVNGQAIEVTRMDTLVKLSVDKQKSMIIAKDWAILYSEYNNEFGLWYKPYIINLNKKDTIRIAGFCYDNNCDDDGCGGGSQLGYNASSDLRYVVLDYICRGFVETVDEDGNVIESFLHDKYFCVLVDIKDASIIMRMDGSNCECEWDDKNNLVCISHRWNKNISELYNTIIFDSEEYKRDNYESINQYPKAN